MPQVSIHGVEVYFRDEGEGLPIVLGHSSTGSGGQWRDLIARLSRRFRLIAPDHIGYGRTGPYPGTVPLMDLEVAVIQALLDVVAEPAHLVGHSFGGSVLARTAVRVPHRVRSLTLIEPTLFHLLQQSGRHAEHAEIRAVADRVAHHLGAGDAEQAARGFIDYWLVPGGFDAMEERVRRSILAGMAKLNIEWASALAPWGATSEALSALRMPILLMRGTKTTSAAAGVVDALVDLWPAAERARIDDAGHMAPLTHPADVNPIIERFLDSVP